jgi:hypothetical protein
MRAGGNWSRSARVKAFKSTRFAVASAKNRATLPSRMVVLARIAGSKVWRYKLTQLKAKV